MQLPIDIPFSFVWVLIAFAVVIAAGLAIKAAEAKAREKKRRNPEHRYIAKDYLISKREREFLTALDPMAANLGLRACPQVRLEDIISVPKGADNHTSSRNRIRAMHIDFVLVEPDTFRIYACIELQDSTHNSPKRRMDDQKKADALQSAGVPLLVFNSTRELQKRGIATLDEP